VTVSHGLSGFSHHEGLNGAPPFRQVIVITLRILLVQLRRVKKRSDQGDLGICGFTVGMGMILQLLSNTKENI
jgi:hypothetical protein